MDELATTIEATCSRLEASHEHTARHLTGSPFAEFATGIHAAGVSYHGITAPSHAMALCSLAAVVLEAGKQFVRDNDPGANREAARQIYVALEERLKTSDALGLLRNIGKGIGTEFTEATTAGVVELELLRLMLRSTYGNVEILLSSLSGASKS